MHQQGHLQPRQCSEPLRPDPGCVQGWGTPPLRATCGTASPPSLHKRRYLQTLRVTQPARTGTQAASLEDVGRSSPGRQAGPVPRAVSRTAPCLRAAPRTALRRAATEQRQGSSEMQIPALQGGSQRTGQAGLAAFMPSTFEAFSGVSLLIPRRCPKTNSGTRQTGQSPSVGQHPRGSYEKQRSPRLVAAPAARTGAGRPAAAQPACPDSSRQGAPLHNPPLPLQLPPRSRAANASLPPVKAYNSRRAPRNAERVGAAHAGICGSPGSPAHARAVGSRHAGGEGRVPGGAAQTRYGRRAGRGRGHRRRAADARARAALFPPQGSCRWRTRPAWCCASPRCCPSSRCRWRSWSSCSARPWRRRGRPRALRAPSRGPRRGARYRPRAPEPPFVPFFPRSYTANAAPGGGFHHGAPRLCPGRLQRAERLRLRRSTERDGHSGAVTRCDTDPSLLRKGSLSPHRKFVPLV